MSSVETTLNEIADARLIAVVRGESAKAAVDVSEALMQGGLRAVEIAFTTPDADDAIRELSEKHGDSLLLGAGTITSTRQARLAAESGVRFLVSPGFDDALVRTMRETCLATIPGVSTPSEVMAATAAGLDTLKLFPGSIGGPKYLEALRGPFPEISFVPTGGVSEENVGAWLRAGAIAVGVGGSLAPRRIEDERHREEIVALAVGFANAVGAASNESR